MANVDPPRGRGRPVKKAELHFHRPHLQCPRHPMNNSAIPPPSPPEQGVLMILGQADTSWNNMKKFLVSGLGGASRLGQGWDRAETGLGQG